MGERLGILANEILGGLEFSLKNRNTLPKISVTLTRAFSR